MRSVPGVSERIDVEGSRRRYASFVYYTGDAISDKTVVECLHSRRKGLIRQIPQGTDPRFRERADCEELGRSWAWICTQFKQSLNRSLLV